MTPDRLDDSPAMSVTVDLVAHLVRAQFPQWADLPVEPVARQGWDNRTFRLGSHLAVRIPSAPEYAAAVEKEDRWLPVLARHVPLVVPEPVATGRASSLYPLPFSIRRWLPGETLDEHAGNTDLAHIARELGAFLRALRSAPATDGPACGEHSFFRGCHPSAYDGEVDQARHRLAGTVDTAACQQVWTQAIATSWTGEPVWFHGDIAASNLLIIDNQLSAVIDWGTCGTGDPACDLAIAWSSFGSNQRQLLRESAGLDDDTWRRARGWALWKTLVTLAGMSSPGSSERQRHVLTEILRDPVVL